MGAKLEILPFEAELETKRVLKMLPSAHAALAELKGIAGGIPDQRILLNTLALQEAKDSSAIENIITTHDELFRAAERSEHGASKTTKEVQNYREALLFGFEMVRLRQLITVNDLNLIQSILESNNAGMRKLPGTALRNARTGEVVYEPPQDPLEIQELMSNLERYINDPSIDDCDVLIKMAVIHYQFESIHPYYDGNGRTGRILNVLYLILNGIQDVPILYLSRYIINNKADYYRLLREVKEHGNWEEWLIYMIQGVTQTARETIELIEDMKEQMQQMKQLLRSNYRFYSHDLLNNLFKYPYTKIEFVMDDLGVSRVTASGYLNTLAKDGVLRKEKVGNSNFYVNPALFDRLKK
ncbi:MAG: Fic family protein [Cryomorphaceae bacterium]|jgi:Fic family protein|nr:Fic family protein [Cryomorphaceae bacterium]